MLVKGTSLRCVQCDTKEEQKCTIETCKECDVGLCITGFCAFDMSLHKVTTSLASLLCFLSNSACVLPVLLLILLSCCFNFVFIVAFVLSSNRDWVC